MNQNSWKIFLEHKVPELYSKGHSDLQISNKLGIDQNLVRQLIQSYPQAKQMEEKRQIFIERKKENL